MTGKDSNENQQGAGALLLIVPQVKKEEEGGQGREKCQKREKRQPSSMQILVGRQIYEAVAGRLIFHQTT